MFTFFLDTFVILYIVLILYENKIVHSEPIGSLYDARDRAVQLGNEYYRKDGIEAFGKYQLESFDEMEAYYCSTAYLDSGDAVNVCIEEVSKVKYFC